MKVVCDTNVFFSSIVIGGPIEEIFFAANLGIISIYISPDIILELSRILKDKAKWDNFKITVVLSNLSKICKLVCPTQKIKFITTDTTDNRILECATAAKADYIITGDKKHLLPLKKYKSIKIISPNQFLVQVLYKKDD